MSEREVDVLRLEFRGAVPHEGDWPKLGDEVTVIGKGVITGETTDEESVGWVRKAKVKMTSAEVAIVPAPPGLFDDLDSGLTNPDTERQEGDSPEEG